jgi:CHRD domain
VIPPNLGAGAIFSTGSGRLTLKIDKQNRTIDYELTYSFPDAAATPIVGTQFVNQAHLHFGQKHTTGGINVWLCQSADNPAPAAVSAATPTCPSPSGTVTGTIAPGQVLALAPQGFPAGQDGFDALLDALQNDAIYGNVHTDRFPTGEIRGQFADRDDD